MKLVEVIKSWYNRGYFGNLNCIKGEQLDLIKNSLLLCDEFSNVKEINLLPYPNFEINQHGIPVDKDFIGLVKSDQVQNYKFDNDLKFNEKIDIFSIIISPPLYDKDIIDSLPEGIHSLPINQNDYISAFSPLKEIRIKYSPESLQDLISLDNDNLNFDEKIDKIFLNKIKELIKSGEVSIPCRRDLIFRLSSRSIKRTEEFKLII